MRVCRLPVDSVRLYQSVTVCLCLLFVQESRFDHQSLVIKGSVVGRIFRKGRENREQEFGLQEKEEKKSSRWRERKDKRTRKPGFHQPCVSLESAFRSGIIATVNRPRRAVWGIRGERPWTLFIPFRFFYEDGSDIVYDLRCYLNIITQLKH